jgi:hypothetical protein
VRLAASLFRCARLHGLDWGLPEKPPFIMLHGISRVAHQFDHFAP